MRFESESFSHSQKNENEKKRQYNQRILQVEHGSFTPLVFSCFGGMSRKCGRFFSHAADHLAEKRKSPKNVVTAWIKARMNFALIRSCIMCIRGTRQSYSTIQKMHDIDIVMESMKHYSCLFMIR